MGDQKDPSSSSPSSPEGASPQPQGGQRSSPAGSSPTPPMSPGKVPPPKPKNRPHSAKMIPFSPRLNDFTLNNNKNNNNNNNNSPNRPQSASTTKPRSRSCVRGPAPLPPGRSPSPKSQQQQQQQQQQHQQQQGINHIRPTTERGPAPSPPMGEPRSGSISARGLPPSSSPKGTHRRYLSQSQETTATINHNSEDQGGSCALPTPPPGSKPISFSSRSSMTSSPTTTDSSPTTTPPPSSPSSPKISFHPFHIRGYSISKEKKEKKERKEGEEGEEEEIDDEEGGIFNSSAQTFASMMKAALDITLTRELQGIEILESKEREGGREGRKGGEGEGGGGGGGEGVPRTRAFAQRKSALYTHLPDRGYGSTYSSRRPSSPPSSPKKNFRTLGKKKKRQVNSFDISGPSSFKKLDLMQSQMSGGLEGVDGELIDALKIAKRKQGDGGMGVGGEGGEGGGGENALRALTEIVETERNYVLDMVLLVTHYKKPCLSNHLLPDDQAEAVFMNVEPLMHIHSKIVENFGEEPTLNSVITSYEDSCPLLIKEYGTFATKYTNAIDVLDTPKLSKDFVHFCERSRQNPANKGLSLGDFLIKPIQRICKYPLLFRELIKFLPDDHPNYGGCKSVRAGMDLVAGRVNEARQRSEGQKIIKTMEERIEGLGGIELNGKEYQLSGMVFVHGHKRTLFLLSDYLLCCQKIRNGKLLLKRAIPFNVDNIFIEILIAQNAPGEEEVKSVLKISCENEGRFLVEFPTKKDALAWAHQFASMEKKYEWIKNYSEKPLTQEEMDHDPLAQSDKEDDDSSEGGERSSLYDTLTLKEKRGVLFGKKKTQLEKEEA